MTGAFILLPADVFRGMLRTVRNCHSRELFDHARKEGRAVVRGLDLDAHSTRRKSIPDKVAFRVDTRAWLDSLTENQRRRASISPTGIRRRNRPAMERLGTGRVYLPASTPRELRTIHGSEARGVIGPGKDARST